jgi:teichuronic acid biosynthesis glycosyltransferase TuaC
MSSSESVATIPREAFVAHPPRLGAAPEPKRTVHVLTLAPFYPCKEDEGRGCFIAEPLKAMEEAGIQNSVLVATPFYRRSKPINDAVVAASGARYFSLPKGFGLASSGAFLFASVVRRVRELVTAGMLNLVHAHGALPCGHAAYLLFRELGLPYLVSVHGLDAYSTKQVTKRPGRWCERVSRMIYESAERVICVSEHVKGEVARGGNFSSEVVYNGVDPEVFAPAANVTFHSPVVLSVGDLIPTKGHGSLLLAIAALLKDFPDLRCEVIGDGPERARLRSLATTLGIQKRVAFRGRVARKDVAAAMQRCTVFALPSHYEALGCVYMEAMACGKTVVGCYGQGIEEIIRNGDNGLLVEPGNLNALTEALAMLLRDAALRGRLGASAHGTVHRQLTIAHQRRNLARIYSESAR